MALPLFAITIFVSAFILFLVQPMIGKMILPKLGGTPQVWNTCMVFFQMVLLAGYFYTHASSTKLSLRRQLMVHAVLLFLPFLILLPNGPFNITDWIPTLGANPLFSTLVLLAAVVGVPFFVVSTSAPLLQKWFAATGHPAAKDPYFLYGASNLGSMLALLLYPFVIELWMDLRPQAWLWTYSYVLLVGSFLACVLLVWKPSGEAKLKVLDVATGGPEAAPPSEGVPMAPPAQEAPAQPATQATTAVTANPPPAPAPAPSVSKQTAVRKGKPPQARHGAAQPAPEAPSIKTDELTTWRRLRWIGLAAVPSSLMLGVTTHITTDLSPIPLFWLIPLSLYLLSFILVFSRWPLTWIEQPHTYMLYIQPAVICLMLFVDLLGASSVSIWGPIAFNVLAFFVTALVCHGELAKDRPSTRHLTEFYLLMAVGGMVGGMFNGILAPVVFVYVWEFSIAVICACLLRPKLKEGGWADDLIAGFLEQPAAPAHIPKGPKGAHHPRPIARVSASASLTQTLDFVLPVAILVLLLLLVFVLEGAVRSLAESMASGEAGAAGFRMFLTFGIPLTICAFYFNRPLRFGLAVAAVIIISAVYQNRGDSSLYADRSYFGIIRVKIGRQAKDKGQSSDIISFTQLIHGHINHGMNIFKPEKKGDWGNPDKDYSRLATTYYHRLGPAGVVMEKYNWFPGPGNTYWGDARLPASMVGMGALTQPMGGLPVGQLVDLWSEPAYATIGLGTGTMASYGRPYQHVHYYEIDNHIRRLNLPLGKNDWYFGGNFKLPEEASFTYQTYAGGTRVKTYFTYLKDAIRRGSEVQVLMGDARLRMDLPYNNFHADPARAGGPENFYHMMVVDAFSSDAIPVHLITQQAIKMYFKHLTEDGILCVHTSNRYVELPKVVAAVASELGYSWKRGHDAAPGGELGHFTSEWVMVAKKAEYMKDLKEPSGYAALLVRSKAAPEPYWNTPTADPRYAWTDDHSNLVDVLRR